MESSAAGWRLEGMPRNDKRLPPSTVGSYHVCAREGGVRVIDRERFLRGLVNYVKILQ